MPKVIFCSFADSRLEKSIERIRAQAIQMKLFDSVKIFSEKDLDKDFRETYAKHLTPGSRGFGFWIWKPQIIKQLFAEVNEGDIVHYADVGCWLNCNGRERMYQYLEILLESQSGILAFKMPEAKPAGFEDFSFQEKKWTKGDLFSFFGVQNNPLYTDTEQYSATTFFMEKNKITEKFISEWSSIWTAPQGWRYIDDSPSVTTNLEGFIEHRHDQSVFSLLAKKYNVNSISRLEIEYPVLRSLSPGHSFHSKLKLDWRALESMPIQARRDKDVGLINRVLIKINNLGVRLSLFGRRNKIWGSK